MSNEERSEATVSETRLRMGDSYLWGQTTELCAKGGHNWVVKKAFDFIRENCPDQLPKDLSETYVHYGIFFADNPWAGRPESIVNAEHPYGERYPSVREDRWGVHYHSDKGPTGEVSVDYGSKDDPSRPNLVLLVHYHGEFLWKGEIKPRTFAADNLSHYAHKQQVTWDESTPLVSGAVIAGPDGNGPWKIGAAAYGNELYKLACCFWPGSSTKPRLDGLTYIPAPGQITLLAFHGDLRANVPGTYLGGNPFILTHDDRPTWPIWVPEKYSDPSQLTENSPVQSKNVAAIYLGWALHMLTDLAQPYHAADKTGSGHEACDSLYDELCREGMFDHLPVFGPGAKYKYSNRHVQDWYMPSLAWRKRYCQSNIAQVLSNMEIASRKELPLVYPSASRDQKLEAVEYLLNWALIDTVGMILELNQNQSMHVLPWLSLLLEP